MFINPSFENGYWHPTKEYCIAGWHFPIKEEGTIVPELQLPNDWNFRWADHTIENPYNQDTWNQFTRPEVRVLNEADIPEHERELFIVHGSHTLKIFRGYGSWYAALEQKFSLEDGLYQARANIFNDAVKNYEDGQKIPALNPNSCQVRLVINDEPSEWRPLYPQYMDSEMFLFSANGETTVSIEIMMPFALKNSCTFADLWNLVEIYKIVEECDHIGLPREQYDRTYVLLPPSYGNRWMRAAINGGWKAHHYTFGGSADDSGIGDLTVKRVIAVNPHIWASDLEEFYTTYYPHVEYVTITAKTPAELTEKLKSDDFDEPSPPPDDPDYDGPVYHKTTRGHWGLHAQILRDGVWAYLQDTTPGIMKYFGLSDVEISVNTEPRTPVIYRHYTPDQNIPDDEEAIHQAARDYIALFKDDTHRKAESLSVNHDFRPLFYVESYNEMYPSMNRPVVRKAALFDAAFAEEMYKEFGDYVGAVLYCAAVGNPHESEYDELLRVAAAAVEYNGILGYHAYWWANVYENGLLSWWEHHAGRWQEIDEYFRKNKLYPRWCSGESGVVYSEDGYALNPGAGWLWPGVYNGNLDRLIVDMMAADDLAYIWNEKYGNRWWGSTFFTTGHNYTGWQWFQFQKPEMERLSEELIARYPIKIETYAFQRKNRAVGTQKRLAYKIQRRKRALKNKLYSM